MSVEFNTTSRLQFTPFAAENTSVSFWLYPLAIDSTDRSIIDILLTPRKKISIINSIETPNALVVTRYYTITPLIMTVDNSITLNTWIHFVTTDTEIYYNGIPSATVDLLNSGGPLGTPLNAIRLGDATDGISSKLQDVRIYDRELNSTEIAELYSSRCQRVIMNGLVFWAPLDGAAGLSRFDGATLGTANTITDWVSGAIGIPYGNPIGRGNTEQRIY